MGFFDKLREVTGAVSKVTGAARNIAGFAEDPEREIARTAENAAHYAADRAVHTAVNKAENAVADKIEDALGQNTVTSGSQTDPSSIQQRMPMKPSREIKGIIYDTAPNGSDAEIPYSFRLSGDFVESESHAAECDQLYGYAPEWTEDFIGDDEIVNGGKPYFFISCGDDKVYKAVESFKKTGSIPGAMYFERVNGSQMLFKAKIAYFDSVMYFYGCDRGYSWKNTGICVVYKKKYAGTAAEANLIAAVDEAAMSYTENRQ